MCHNFKNLFLFTLLVLLFQASNNSFATEVRFATTAINAMGNVSDDDCIIFTLDFDDSVVATTPFSQYIGALQSVTYEVVGGTIGSFTTISSPVGNTTELSASNSYIIYQDVSPANEALQLFFDVPSMPGPSLLSDLPGLFSANDFSFFGNPTLIDGATSFNFNMLKPVPEPTGLGLTVSVLFVAVGLLRRRS